MLNFFVDSHYSLVMMISLPLMHVGRKRIGGGLLGGARIFRCGTLPRKKKLVSVKLG